ncbi:MAG: cytochrome C, partial [Alphaproteobacteria bacterium]
PKARHSNHAFYGPGYPIAHPGIFPFNPRGLRWSIKEWLTFDYRAGWGLPDFEDKLADGVIEKPDFPDVWKSREDRMFARFTIQQNEKLLEDKRRDRLAVMENGSRIDGPFFDGDTPAIGKDLSFRYRITNTDKGHNLPSGSLGAQPEIWFNVALIDPDGKNIWESGYVDSNGDMADLHSLDLAAGKIEHDDQLFNLQTKFLTTNVKGTDREMYLPVQFDIDQLPFLRPANLPTTVLNHPPFVRMEGRSIPPLGWRDAKYEVPRELLTKPGTYKLQARLRSRAEPIYFMRFVGATREMEERINDWMIDIHPYAVEFEIR